LKAKTAQFAGLVLFSEPVISDILSAEIVNWFILSKIDDLTLFKMQDILTL